ncbi:helix-turn-helix domain-containing protein [Candidatus Poriferisodalis sp.]|uniref:TetR/AcrR family transcriptional regulator n=1 Tax=Candidatus Poriferisodalis sp. TaxID=3101277 RepID=UPI003B51C010
MLDEEDSENTRVRAQTRELTTRLLDAAVSAFSERGFEAARVADIARRCKLTTGAIYSRWQTKRDLFLDAVEYATTNTALVNVASSDMNIMDKFEVLGADHLSSIGDKFRSLVLEACVLARRDETLKSQVSRALDTETQAYSALIEAAKAEGYVNAELDTQCMLLCYQALNLGLELILSLETRPERRPSLEDWRAVIASYMSGAYNASEDT